MIADVCTLTAHFPGNPSREALAIQAVVIREDVVFDVNSFVQIDMRPVLEQELIKAMDRHLHATHYEAWEAHIAWTEQEFLDDDDGSAEQPEIPTSH